MEKYKILCDYQEDFESESDYSHINDHQTKETFIEIEKSIKALGYQCEIFGGVPELLQAQNSKPDLADTIFLNLSDGLSQQYSRVQIPILCDMLGVKYSGGNPFTVALTSNKFYTKLAVEKLGVPIPWSILINANNLPDQRTLKTIPYPVIIKPNCEGSSVGIDSSSICKNSEQLHLKMFSMLERYSEIIIEKFIPGYDITNFIIGNVENFRLNQTLAAFHDKKIIDDQEIMSINDYIAERNSYEDALKFISDYTNKKIMNYSQSIVSKLDIYDIARIDYRVTKTGEIYFLEVNTVPAIHRRTQAGSVCKILNITFEHFLDLYVSSVKKRLQKSK